MATKKRAGDEKAKTTTKGDAPRKPRAPKAATAAGATRKATAAAAAKGSARPRLRASHASASGAAPRAKRAPAGGLARRTTPIAPLAERSQRPPASKRTPGGAPKRQRERGADKPPAPSDKAQQLAVSIAIAGLDKKALAIEILDVTGKVDYADFLVVMTGRSDRHVHSIATGIEEALLRKNKVKPLSVEGLATATWVLLDFGDVVVHVFQEDSRRLYDIEGLWIDAGRVSLPEDQQKVAVQIDQTEGAI